MKISGIRIENVRNHLVTDIDLNIGLNVIFGLNGAGKTSILEAISICGFSKSFLPVPDSSLIKTGNSSYSVMAKAVSDNDIPYKISIVYEKSKRKRIASTMGDNLLAKDIIGEMPMVILSPDYKSITFGSPEYRRSFIDRLLSQASKVYFEYLLDYKRALKQRNSLLADFASGKKFDSSLLKPWTDLLIKNGSEIMFRRIAFLKEFKVLFKQNYEKISSGKEDVNIEYSPSSFGMEDIHENVDGLGQKLSLLFENNQDEERRRAISVFGPQKDDIRILINGGIAREFASQGQHKSLLVALKFAEFSFLTSKRNETPIVLLDDIFSELDEERIKMVFDLIKENSAQTIITVTDPDVMGKIINDETNKSFFEVVDGIVFKK